MAPKLPPLAHSSGSETLGFAFRRSFWHNS
nr:MAG TPA: hypothetical protein [Bacteriophage sp.]